MKIILFILLLLPVTVMASERELIEFVFNQPIEHFVSYSTTVTLSAYTASVDETNDQPYITANLTPSRIGLVAVSRDIIDELGLHLGQTVVLPPYGVFQIQDLMHERWTRRIDLLHATKKSAKLFGVKENMTLIWIPWDGRSLRVSMQLN